MFHSLHIGLNYAGTSNALRGCVNDAMDWAKHFSPILGSNPVVLLEQQADKATIISQVKAVLDICKSGDTAIISYSGHGTYIPDQSGDESDRRDEALVPWDYSRGLLLDDELKDLLSKRPQGTRVLLITDCCHSGTMARSITADWKWQVEWIRHSEKGYFLRWTSSDGLYFWLHPLTGKWVGEPDQINMPLFPNHSVGQLVLNTAAHPEEAKTPRYVPFSDLTACMCPAVVDSLTHRPAVARAPFPDDGNLVHWSGCLDSEVSYDATIGGRPCGAFTNAAIAILNSGLVKGTPHSTIQRLMADRLPSQRYQQTPQFNGDLSLVVPGFDFPVQVPAPQPQSSAKEVAEGVTNLGRKFRLEIE